MGCFSLTVVGGGSGSDGLALNLLAATLKLELGDALRGPLAASQRSGEGTLAEDLDGELGNAAGEELDGQSDASANVGLGGLQGSGHQGGGSEDGGGLHFDGFAWDIEGDSSLKRMIGRDWDLVFDE